MSKKPTYETIEAISKRLGSFINPVTKENLKSFFDGFRIGNISARNDLIFSDYTNVWMEIIKSRGWQVKSMDIEKQMYEKGMSESEIITEVLSIEIEIWKKLEKDLAADQ